MVASESNSFQEKHFDEKHEKLEDVTFSTKDVDTAAILLAGDEGELDPAEGLRVRCVRIGFFKNNILKFALAVRLIEWSCH